MGLVSIAFHPANKLTSRRKPIEVIGLLHSRKQDAASKPLLTNIRARPHIPE
jgi:hypothetical protein